MNQLRIPVKYLANLLTAGDTQPVVRALERMLASARLSARQTHVEGVINIKALQQVNLTEARCGRDVSRDGDRQLRGSLRDPDHPS